MHIYCETCNNMQLIHFQKKQTLISRNKIKGELRCAICFTKRSFIDDIKYDLEGALELYLQFFTD